MDKVEEKIPRKDKLIRFIKIAQSNWQRATVNQSAAEMAYFLLLSLFPILLVLANTIPLLPIDANEVLSITSDFVPQDVFGVIEPIIRNYLESGSGGAISIGLLAALWSASRVITILRRVLDEVYGSIQTSNFIIGRVVSLFTMIGIVLVIGAAVFAFVFGDQILQFIQDTIGVTIPFIQQFLLF